MSAEGSHKPIYQKHSCVPGFSEQSRIVGPYIDHLEKSRCSLSRLLLTALVPHERRAHLDDRGSQLPGKSNMYAMEMTSGITSIPSETSLSIQEKHKALQNH